MTPSLYLSSSLHCGNHGTIAVAQLLRVVHYLPCVRWNSICVCHVCSMIRVHVCRSSMICLHVCRSSMICVHVCRSSMIMICVLLCRTKNRTFHSAFWNCMHCCTAAAVLCHLYHTVPRAFKLSTLCQPRSNRTSTASLVWSTSMRVLALLMRQWCVLWYVVTSSLHHNKLHLQLSLFNLRHPRYFTHPHPEGVRTL